MSELDQAVHKVMNRTEEPVPHYSTSWADCKEVLNYLDTWAHEIDEPLILEDYGGNWECWVEKGGHAIIWDQGTFPEALCRALLQIPAAEEEMRENDG